MNAKQAITLWYFHNQTESVQAKIKEWEALIEQACKDKCRHIAIAGAWVSEITHYFSSQKFTVTILPTPDGGSETHIEW